MGSFFEIVRSTDGNFTEQYVISVVQAHLHYVHTKIIQTISFATSPAMGDNICEPTFQIRCLKFIPF